MRKIVFLPIYTALLAVPVLAAPTGKIGFIGESGAQVWNLSTGRTQTVPKGQKADNFAFSSRGDAVFFVPTGQKSTSPDAYSLSNGYLSRPPYTTSRPIPALQGASPDGWLWSPSGNSLYIYGYQLSSVYTPATGALKRGATFPTSLDAAGKKLGYSDDTTIRVRDVNSGKEQILFSTKNPKPLFQALRRAKNQKNVSDLLEGETMTGDPNPWQIAGPVLSPDGTRAYFASNAGTGYGAAGNGMQGIFACDLKTGTISVLSKVGSLFGRPPEMSISPDGNHLLAALSVHDSAIDNSTVVYVIDLLTQKSREILGNVPGSAKHANFYGGGAWSPDSKYVAVSGYFYDTAKIIAHPDGNYDEPKNKDWTMAIIDAANGKVVKVKKGARAPGWSR